MQTSTFAELGLSAKVLAAIDAAGYPAPTPIQAQAIPIAVMGRDVLGIAQTGTGKTASFVLPMITRLETGRARARMPRSLILAPTRELAAQCAQSFEKYGQNHKLSVALLIGGVSMDDQVRKLDRGVDVLIATPGRLLDHFGRGRIMLMGVEILVIDEADRMLDMGFIPDIERICKLLPPTRQTLFFSATMPPEITRLVDQFLKDPVRIEVARPATTAKTITQRFKFCDSTEDWAKRESLREILRGSEIKNAIIFSNYKRDVAILLKSLTKHGFNAGALHGDMDQTSRMATLDKFRAGEIQLLAASDVAARGLDIPDVSHVINYDVPWQPEDYVHRIGRTGRAGKEGNSITIVTIGDVKHMDSISKLIGETPTWIGEAPDADVLEEGRTMKGRGRGRKGASTSRGRERGPERGRSRGPQRPVRETRERMPTRAHEPRADERPSPSGDRPQPQPPRAREREREAPNYQDAPIDRPAQDQAFHDQPRRAEPRRRRPSEYDGGETRPVHDDGGSRRQETRDRAPRREEHRPSRDDERGNRRPSHARDDDQPRAEQPPRRERPRPEAGSQRPSQGGGNTPVGLGDHVPAFLRRPVRANID